MPKLAGPLKGGVLALLADCTTRFISDRAQPDVVKHAITRAGGEMIELSDFGPEAAAIPRRSKKLLTSKE